MFNLLQNAEGLFEIIKSLKENNERNQLLRFAILAEAKFNNDLAEVICKSNAKKIAEKSPEIFDQFSTVTSDTLMMLSIPAYKVLGESKKPNNRNVEELDRASAHKNLFEKKTASELYEFYIRKCNLLKALSQGNAITITKISLQKRCKNISYATYFLGKKCDD